MLSKYDDYAKGQLLRREITGFSCRNHLRQNKFPKRYFADNLLIIVIFDILLMIIFWGVLIYNNIINDNAFEYFGFYTNWTWTYNTMFYTLDFLCITIFYTRYQEYLLQMTLWWSFYCNSWMVSILAVLMLWSNPRMLSDNLKSQGGEMHANVVYVGNFVVHVSIILIAVFYLILRWNSWKQMLIITFYDDLYKRKHGDIRKYLFFVYIVLMALSGPVVFVIYYNVFDFKVVYNVDISIGFGMLVVFGIILFTIPFTILFIMIAAVKDRKNLDTDSWTTEPNTPSKEDIEEFKKQFSIK